MDALPLAMLLLVSAAQADASATTFTVERVDVPMSPVAPGGEALFRVAFTRTCASPAFVVPEQVVEVIVHAPDGWSAKTNGSYAFEQQVCATQPGQTLMVEVVLGVAPTAGPGAWNVPVDVVAHEAGTLSQVHNGGHVPEELSLMVADVVPQPAPGLAPATSDIDGQQAPPPFAFAAWAARRRHREAA